MAKASMRYGRIRGGVGESSPYPRARRLTAAAGNLYKLTREFSESRRE